MTAPADTLIEESDDDLIAAGRLVKHFMARLPLGWRWLMRSDEEQGYFVNFLSPNFEQVTIFGSGGGTIDASHGQRYNAYGASLSDAVVAAASKIPQTVWVGAR